MSKESFVFYRSFFEATQDLNDQDKFLVQNAILNYVFLGQKPQLSGISKTIWTLIKPQLDANNRKYENGKKGGRYGYLGGRPKKEKPLENPTGVSKNNPEITPNVNVNVNENALGDFQKEEKEQQLEGGKKSVLDEMMPIYGAGDKIIGYQTYREQLAEIDKLGKK